MKLAVTAFSVQSIPDLIDAGADIIIAGNGKYANRLTNSFSNLELQEIRDITKANNTLFYVQVNRIVHNEHLQELEQFLDTIFQLDVDGIIFGDLAVYQIAKRKHQEHLLIYNPETLNTNYYDAVFWQRKGLKGLTISKEIPLDDMEQFRSQSSIELSIIGHGFLNMFHSRRPLIENFFKYKEEDYTEYVNNRNLRLVEEIRHESYPVFQDDHGTHIFRDKIMSSYQDFYDIQQYIDVFIIDGIFKDTKYILETVANYRHLIQEYNPQQAEQFAQQYEKDHDTGFLHKKTVYDKL